MNPLSLRKMRLRAAWATGLAAGGFAFVGFDPFNSGNGLSAYIGKAPEFAIYWALFGAIITKASTISSYAIVQMQEDLAETLPAGKPIKFIVVKLPKTLVKLTSAFMTGAAATVGGMKISTTFFDPAKSRYDLEGIRKASDIDVGQLGTVFSLDTMRPNVDVTNTDHWDYLQSYALSKGEELQEVFRRWSPSDLYDTSKEIYGQSGSIVLEGLLASATPEGAGAFAVGLVAPIAGVAVGWYLPSLAKRMILGAPSAPQV